MRLLHFSDIHIGVETYGRPFAEQDLAGLPDYFAPGEDRAQYLGHSTRVVDFLCAFDELVDYATSNEVDAVLFSGDAYKTREPSQTHQREFAKRVARLADNGVPVFLLVGNHDLPHAAYKATAVEIFETLSVPNVTVADTLGTSTVQTRAGPLQVLALPWIRRSVFLGRDETRNLPYDQVNRLMEEKLTEALQYYAEGLDPRVPSAVVAHVSLNTARLGTERSMMVGYDHTLLQSNVTTLAVDYIALGHIHRPQRLSESPPAAYAGSLQRVDFGEEDHAEKGFWEVTVDPGRAPGSRVTGLDFRAVRSREFVTVDATVTEGDPDPTQTVIRAVGRYNLGGAIVRVNVKLPASLEPAFREREVHQALAAHGAHTVAGVNRLVDRPQRTRLGDVHAETKTPLEMLRIYLDSKEVSPDRAGRLASYAERLVLDEETREAEGHST